MMLAIYGIENIMDEGLLFWKVFLLEVVNPFPNKPWFLHVYSTSLLKTP